MKRYEQTAFPFATHESTSAPRSARAARAVELGGILLPIRPAVERFVDIDPHSVEIDEDADQPAGEDERARYTLERQIAMFVPHGRLSLSVTDNRHTMISVKREHGTYRLRLHHMFLAADAVVIRALGRYVGQNDRESSRLLGRFIDVHQRKIRGAPRRRKLDQQIVTTGEIHDLAAIYDDVNAQYFAGAINARITWGQRAREGARKRRRNSIKMGSYSVEDQLIRIHPSLDRSFVPRLFVEWIVYHEMLHQKHDIPIVGGRRQFHTAAFLADEAKFLEYHQVRHWERVHLDRLLLY